MAGSYRKLAVVGKMNGLIAFALPWLAVWAVIHIHEVDLELDRALFVDWGVTQ